jgi:hypothetical protein
VESSRSAKLDPQFARIAGFFLSSPSKIAVHIAAIARHFQRNTSVDRGHWVGIDVGTQIEGDGMPTNQLTNARCAGVKPTDKAQKPLRFFHSAPRSPVFHGNRWRLKGCIYRPPKSICPVLECDVVDAVVLASIRVCHVGTVNANQWDVPAVAGLCFAGSPTAILWRVPKAVVDAIKAESWRLLTHVSYEICVAVPPSVANRYSSGAVVFVARPTFIVATPDHGPPVLVLSALRVVCAACLISVYQLFKPEAPATEGLTVSKVSSSPNYLIAAFAGANPCCRCVKVFRSTNHFQPAKNHPG